MDYEKKYKEALERARKWYNDSHITIGLKGNLEDIFPELKKEQRIDDETLRKNLIKAFNTVGVKHWGGLEVREILTWLNKQDEIDLEHYKDGENEKRKFVGYGFLKCKGDFLSFKEGETYWLEYIGKDNYNVRSDNLLEQTFHIKPVELYTVFCPTTWLEKQGSQEESQVYETEDGKTITYSETDGYKVIEPDDLIEESYQQQADDLIDMVTEKPAWSEEDERIRKTLIDYFRWNTDSQLLNEFTNREVFAWLEKQGEQKSIIKMKTPEESLGIDSDTYNEIVDARIYDEQKPDDKVEPKFHKGDWIVFNGLTLYVEEVVRGFYITVSIDGNYSSYDWNIDSSARLWTLNDAKDGDVLYAADRHCYFKEYIFMFSSFTEDNVMSTHFGYDVFHGTFDKDITRFGREEDFMFVTPATKKRRELLFQKMKENDYELDSEKKELKKILITPRFETGDVLCDKTCTTLDKKSQPNFEIIDIRNNMYICDKCSFPIYQQDEYELVAKKIKQYSTWSEEDEELMKWSIINLTELKDRFGEEYGKVGDCIDWLKSLRPQNTWKPSEEQYEALDYAYNSCSDTERGNYYEGVLETLIEDLHKLSETHGEKPQGKTTLEAVREEKIDNQNCVKPADKVEPKFKVGNWYQCTKDFFGKGVTFDKNTAYYCAIEGCLQDEYGCHIAIDKDLYGNFKLWDSTKDVKDGDVLVDVYGNIGICEQCDDFDWVSYCSLGCNGGFQHFKIEHENEKTYPATKKQRDTLMKAMADAGYTFDFEKKELKRIEQKPVSITDEWIEDYWRHHKVINPYSYDKGEEIQFDHQGFVRFCKKYCRKPAWSEEDEYNFNTIHHLLDLKKEKYKKQENREEINRYNILRKWFKSLKQRIGE